MFWSLLFYPTLSAQANENDGAVIIKLGGEVIPVETSTQSVPVATPISLDVVHMDITEVIRIFAIHSGQNILLSDGIQGTVTARVTNVPWNLALQSIVQSNGWTVTTIGEILLIEPLSTSTK